MNKIPEFNCVDYIHFDTADHFLSYLYLLNDHWGNELKCPWVFRGQGDASWGLVPKAWRKEAYGWLRPTMISLRSVAEEAWDSLYKGYGQTKNYDKDFVIEVLTHTTSIFELTYRFVELADELGYSVPGMNTIYSGAEFIRSHEWPSQHYHALCSHVFTVAQHHGLPTHLLDWTRNPQFAAFFAADSSWNSFIITGNFTEPPDLAVWAINLKEISGDIPDANTLNQLTCPRSEHGFLHAQDALFLWHPMADLFYLQYGHWPDFIEIMEKSYNEGQPKPVRKIILRGRAVNDLYRKLLRLRISRAHLMPTFDNIAKTLEQSSFLFDLEKELFSDLKVGT